MNAEVIQGVVRHVLTGLAGYLVAKGALDPGSAETIIGAVVALVGTGWSIVNKQKPSA